MTCAAHTRLATVVRQLEGAYDIPSPRMQFTPLLFAADGTTDFYFETQGASGIAGLNREGRVVRQSGASTDILALVEEEFQRVLAAFTYPRSSL